MKIDSLKLTGFVLGLLTFVVIATTIIVRTNGTENNTISKVLLP